MIVLPEDWEVCDHCNGSGVVTTLKGKKAGEPKKCPKCKGAGGRYIMAGLAIVGIIILVALLYM